MSPGLRTGRIPRNAWTAGLVRERVKRWTICRVGWKLAARELNETLRAERNRGRAERSGSRLDDPLGHGKRNDLRQRSCRGKFRELRTSSRNYNRRAARRALGSKATQAKARTRDARARGKIKTRRPVTNTRTKERAKEHRRPRVGGQAPVRASRCHLYRSVYGFTVTVRRLRFFFRVFIQTFGNFGRVAYPGLRLLKLQNNGGPRGRIRRGRRTRGAR